jgi:hypothetical protein
MATAETEKLDYEKILFLFKESDRRFNEQISTVNEAFRLKSVENDKILKELSKQIGGLGNKFGSYNEALFIPSLIKLLESKFNCNKTFPNARFKDNGNTFEIDLLGVSDSACYLVEIKSHLKSEGIRQLINLIQQFNEFGEEYAGKKKYGMITATNYSEQTKNEALKEGIYFISITDEIAKLAVPEDFVPKQW